MLLWLTATCVRAEKDAAIKAQEGDINHWIDYYRKNQQPSNAVTPARQPIAQGKEKAEEGREKAKGER